jgi:hypothetical protein
LRILSVILLTVVLCSCTKLTQPQENTTLLNNANTEIRLSTIKESNFKQVEAVFSSDKSKQQVFLVLSNLQQTPQWFDKLMSIKTLVKYNNKQFLTRSIINSPWPIRNRELITCVNTQFSKNETRIDILACPTKAEHTKQLVTVTKARSSWVIKQLPSGLTQIFYKAWLEPGGFIPATLFNHQLISSTKRTIRQLQKTLAQTEHNNYGY